MEQNGTPAGDDKLLLAFAAGATAREAAEQAGIGERNAHRRLADADFRRAREFRLYKCPLMRWSVAVILFIVAFSAALAARAPPVFHKLLPPVFHKLLTSELTPTLSDSPAKRAAARL